MIAVCAPTRRWADLIATRLDLGEKTTDWVYVARPSDARDLVVERIVAMEEPETMRSAYYGAILAAVQDSAGRNRVQIEWTTLW